MTDDKPHDAIATEETRDASMADLQAFGELRQAFHEERVNDLAAKVREFIPNSEAVEVRHNGRGSTVFMFCPPGGFGLPFDLWTSYNARLTESYGGASLGPRHKHHGTDAHHILVITVLWDAESAELAEQYRAEYGTEFEVHNGRVRPPSDD